MASEGKFRLVNTFEGCTPSSYKKKGYGAIVLAGVVALSNHIGEEENMSPAGGDYQYYFDEMQVNQQILLSYLARLGANWDGYGAEPVHLQAIQNTTSLLHKLSDLQRMSIEIMPTHHGAILLKSQTFSGNLLKCEIGDKQMSYFIRRKGYETRYFSFVDWNEENCKSLVQAINDLV